MKSSEPMKASVTILLLCLSCGRVPVPVADPILDDPAPKEVRPSPVFWDEGLEMMIYYRHPQIEGIVAKPRRIYKLANQADQIKQVIDQLTIAPEDGSGLAIWPDSVYVRELYLLTDGTVVVDFHQNFVSKLNVGATSESFMVYSLVNTILENFPDYTKVRLLIHGEAQETFLGHIDIEWPLTLGDHLYKIVPEIHEEDQILIEELSAPDWQEEGLN